MFSARPRPEHEIEGKLGSNLRCAAERRIECPSSADHRLGCIGESERLLKRMSVLQSIMLEAKSGPVPISISSQSLIEVNSTATAGPRLAVLGAAQFPAGAYFKVAVGSFSSAFAAAAKRMPLVAKTATNRLHWSPRIHG